MSAQRVVALWFPDWPVQAVRLAREDGEEGPMAIACQYRIEVCDVAARVVGVRRGMCVRQAQALCPELDVVDANPERDGEVFAAIVDSLDDVAASVQVLRPGLVVIDVAAAGRFHGSEDRALELLIDAAAWIGADMCIGVADELTTAVIAARHGGVGTVVPSGSSREFLAAQPVGVLAAEVSLGIEPALTEQLIRLGVCRLGQLADLPLAQVTTRFGEPGRRAHHIACAEEDRRVAPGLPVATLAVAVLPEEPIGRVDAAAFAARELAARLHERLAVEGLVCLRLQVVAELEDGTRLEGVWRTREALSEDATADRVRWQLDGWLSQARVAQTGGIVGLELNPIEVAVPAAEELCGRRASEDQAQRVIARVQSQLGTDRVLVPHAAGGRGVEERIELVPYGEERDPIPQGMWPGRIPSPLPARLGGGGNHPASRIKLVDAAGTTVAVNVEALLSAEPYAARWGEHTYLVAAWAGPWPVDCAWWRGEEDRVARLQLVGQASDEDVQRAWLLAWRHGSWCVEAAYF